MTIRASRGFTLIESIMVIVITGIIAATVAIFIKPSIDSYASSVHRAELTDAVDTALRRLARDVRTAVPNSLRQHSNTCIEYAPIKAAGRYRQEGVGALDFGASGDREFAVLRMTPDTAPAAGDQIVIYNLAQDVADIYKAAPNNRATVAADSTAALIKIKQAAPVPFPFPLPSPGAIFQVVDASGPVAVVCDNIGTVGGNGTGRLLSRRANVTGVYQAAMGCPAATANTTDALLVDRVSACVFNYIPDVLKRHGLLTISLSLTRDDETVNLVQQIHVDNIP